MCTSLAFWGRSRYGPATYQPAGDKTMRMHAQTAVIENGFVHIPETAPWLAEYLHELAVFPNGKHDDRADSTPQFLDWFKTPFAGKASTSTTAASTQRPSSAASRSPPKPYRRSAPWSGPPSRRKRGQPRRLTPCLIPRRMSSDTARQLSSP
jgi:hypothetical protein